jgi:hypothetical protein
MLNYHCSHNVSIVWNKDNQVFKLYTVFFCVGVMYSGEYDACDVTLATVGQAYFSSLPGVDIHSE